MEKAQQNSGTRSATRLTRPTEASLGDRVLFAEDMITAETLKGPFYTPMNCDWRGRVYALSHFNFQREDRVRALFLFANGEPIGAEASTG